MQTQLRSLFHKVCAMAHTAKHASYPQKHEARDRITEFLESFGFEYLDSGCYSRAFKHKGWGGIVLKVSSCEVNRPNLARWPKLRPIWLKPLFQSALVMIQPLCDTSDEEAAHEDVMARLGLDAFDYSDCDSGDSENYNEPSRNCPHDLHTGNVGYFRGRAVAFDIMAN